MSVSTTAPPQLSSLDLRAAFAHVPQSVVLIGAEIAGAPAGLLASTFTVGVSLDPPLATVAVQHSSRTWPQLREHPGHLGVSVLGGHQEHLPRQLATKDSVERFAGVEYETDDDGALLLPDSPLRLSTRIYDQFPAGDHDVVVLEILGLSTDSSQPGLVFHRSGFTPLASPEAQTTAERPSQGTAGSAAGASGEHQAHRAGRKA